MNAYDYAARLLFLMLLLQLALIVHVLNTYGLFFCPAHHEWEACS